MVFQNRSDHGENLCNGDEGAGLVEYALLISLIAIALVAAMVFLAGGLEDFYSQAGSVFTE